MEEKQEKVQEEDTTVYAYDTLPPLFFSDEPQSGSSTLAGDFELPANYSVYRNKITDDGGKELSEIPSAAFFSLDVSRTPVREETRDTFSPLEEAEPLPPPPPEGTVASEKAWFHPGRRFRSPMLQLHKEILDFCEFLSPTPEEQESRAKAVQSVSDVIKHIWPECKVEVFGSFRTGLYLPTSDVDVVILDSKVITPQIGLKALAKALTQKSIVKKMQVIAKARVPIIKFIEKHSELPFDISFDIDGGPKAADYIKDAVKKLPPLRPLSLILKVFLQQRELNEVFSGGIGSYALLSMLIAHLQIYWGAQDMQSHGQPKEQNLGVLLISFFEFYGRKLNNRDIGVSCNSTSNFYLKTDRRFLNKDKDYLLSLQDPQQPDNDIAKSSYNYYKVKSAFANAFSILTDSNSIMDLGSKSILGTIIRPDSELLNRKGGENGDVHFLANRWDPLDSPFQNGGSNIVYNWQLMDDDPLPRSNIVDVDMDMVKKKKKKRRHDKHNERSSEREYADLDRERVKKRGIVFKDEEERESRRKKKSLSKDFDRHTNMAPQNSGSSRR